MTTTSQLISPDKTHENTQATPSRGHSAAKGGIADYRPEAIAGRKLVSFVNNSPQANDFGVVQRMAANPQGDAAQVDYSAMAALGPAVIQRSSELTDAQRSWRNLCHYSTSQAETVASLFPGGEEDLMQRFIDEAYPAGIRGHASQMGNSQAKPNKQTRQDITAFTEWFAGIKAQMKSSKKKKKKGGRRKKGDDSDSD